MAMKPPKTIIMFDIVESNTSNLFDYLYFFYYKLLGINFGGLSIDKNGCIKKSFGWKVYGYLLIIITALILWYLTYEVMNSEEMLHLKETKRPFLYELMLISWLVRNMWPLITLVTVHRYGLKLILLTIKYKIQSVKHSILFKIFWIIHLISLFGNSAFDLFSHKQLTTFSVFGLLIQLPSIFAWDIIYISMTYSISFICWKISFGVYERLKSMRKQLTQSKLNLYEMISMRKQFLEMRNDLIEADSCTQFVFFVDCASITFTLMLNIYLFVARDKSSIDYISFLIYCLFVIPKLIGDCIICGLVHDQADQLLKTVHQIDFDIANDRFYKELMLFKTISSEVNFGFSFGGLVPLERTALLSVIKYFSIVFVLLINKILFCRFSVLY